MLILSTIKPNDAMINHVSSLYPDFEFAFYNSMEDARNDLKFAEILITYGEDLTPEIIHEAVKLKWVMVMSAGLEMMPFEAIKERGILVTNARGIHKIPMAEYTITMMLHVAKQIKMISRLEDKQEWNRQIPTFELNNKTVGILGVGAIGGEIARLSKAFNMKVIGVTRSGYLQINVDEMYKLNDLEKIISKVDFLISVLPSTNETRYILDKQHFELMKKEAVFINIGRGDLVKEEVLLQALDSEQIKYAVLDVFEKEPLRKDHPFWKHDKITITPHISSRNENYLPRCFEIFEQNLNIYKNGGNEFINQINLDRGY